MQPATPSEYSWTGSTRQRDLMMFARTQVFMTLRHTQILQTDRRRLVAAAVVLLLAVHAGLLAYSATRHSPTMLEPALLAAGLSHWEFGRFELYRVNPPLVRMVAALPVMAAGYEADWTGFYESPGARPEFSIGADFIAANGERSIWLFTIARWACIPFSLLGGWFAFCYSRELWDNNAAGLLTLSVWCFEPTILAHAELITNDVAFTAISLWATWLFWRWLKSPTWGRAIAAGLILGVAMVTKASALLFLFLWPPLTLFWWLTSTHNAHASSRPLGFCTYSSHDRDCYRGGVHRNGFCHLHVHLITSLVIALYVVNTAYLFDGTFTHLKAFDFTSSALSGHGKSGQVGNRFVGTCLADVPAPLPKQYILGVDTQKHDFESWHHPGYLHGEWRDGGWWYYYLYGMMVKMPHGFQVLLVVVSFIAVRQLTRRRAVDKHKQIATERSPVSTRNHSQSRHGVMSSTADAHEAPLDASCDDSSASAGATWRDTLILLAPGITLFVLASAQSEMSEHFRYVLPTIGTLTVLVGRVGVEEQSGAAKSMWFKSFRRAVITGSLIVMTSSVIRVYPHHLAYFNECSGGYRSGWQHMLGSSLEFGQDLLLLDRWLQEHERPACIVSVLSSYKMPYSRSTDDDGAPIYLIIGKSVLQRPDSSSRHRLNISTPLTKEELEMWRSQSPIDEIGGSILVFRIHSDTGRPGG